MKQNCGGDHEGGSTAWNKPREGPVDLGGSQCQGFDITLFLAGAGILGLVIAFAAQDTLGNLFSGIHILLDRPFKTGDIIILDDGRYCRVDKIGLQSTHLYSIFEHILVIVPNNQLTTPMSRTITEPTRQIKEKIQIGVAYGTDSKMIADLLEEIVGSHPNVISDPDKGAVARFQEFGDSSLNFTVYFWVDDLDNRYRVKHEINLEIDRIFRERGIEIPFPQRDLHIRTGGIPPAGS